MLKNLALNNLVPVGNAYYIGPDNTQLTPAGAIRMRYDKLKFAAMGLPESEIGLYEFTSDGALLFKLPRQLVNAETAEVVAEVPKLYSLFAVLAKSYEPPPSDIMMPETLLEFNGTVYNAESGAVYITTSTKVRLTAADWDDAYKTGLLASYYFRDRRPDFVCLKTGRDITKPAGTCENPGYFGEFTLEEGTHTIYYQSVDNARNFEFVKSTDVYVDATPPVVELFVGTSPVADGGMSYLTEADSVTLSTADPEINGVASGVKTVYALVDVTPEECQSDSPPAACAGAEYPGPFTLQVGAHTFYYAAVDNVGNMSEIKQVNISVAPKVKVGVAWVSTGSIKWEWEAVAGAASYTVFSPLAGVIASGLDPSVTSYVQENLSPNTLYSARLDVVSNGGNFSTDVSSAVTLANPPGVPEVFAIGQYPSIVIGQSDLVSRNPDLSQSGLYNPTTAVVDGQGNLWVSDSGNRRVLRFPKGQSVGMNADLVIGQKDFLSTSQGLMAQDKFYGSMGGVAVDTNEALWVADDCRILRFSPPFSNGMNADLVLGGNAFTSCDNTVHPWSIRFDSAGSLWVSDWQANKILKFEPPFLNGKSASLELSWFTYFSGATGQQMTSGFSSPRDIDFDSQGTVYIAEYGMARVLGFKPPFYNGMRPSLVIGDPDFDSLEYWGVASNRLRSPSSVTFDGFDNMYVADAGNSRVLKFRPPFSSGMSASLVLGQPDFNTRFNLNVANSFNYPFDAEVEGFVVSDSEGRLWVSDSWNNRVLAFEPVYTGIYSNIRPDGFTISWLSGGNPAWTNYQPEVSQSSDFTGPVIGGGSVNELSETFSILSPNTRYYSRVKATNLDGVETKVIGLNSVLTRPAATTLNGTSEAATSIQWHWAADASLNYQVLSSTGAPISGVLPEGTSWYLQTGLDPNRPYFASLRTVNAAGYTDSLPAAETTLATVPGPVQPFVNGQSPAYTLGTGQRGLGEDRFAYPFSLGLSPDLAVWVADIHNCRLLRFSAPQYSGMSADLVLGQSGFNSSVCGTAPDKISSEPGYLTFDKDGNLWFTDGGNHRVMRFPAPLSDSKGADLVLGQTSLYANVSGRSAYKFNEPGDVHFDTAGNLWVADVRNHRVLRFEPPFAADKPASLVLGQPDFTSDISMPENPAYFTPHGITIDDEGNVWVAAASVWVNSAWENRVLKFSPPFSNGMAPSLVMHSSGMNLSPSALIDPWSISFDQTGSSLYVGDQFRVLKFDPPFKDGQEASAVLGKDSFYSTSEGSIDILHDVEMLKSTAGPVVLVTDPKNYRVQAYAALDQSFYGVYVTSAAVKWSGLQNPPGTEYKAEISYTRDFSNVTEGLWNQALLYGFTNLTENTSCYVRVKARNTSGRESAYAYLGSFLTQPEITLFTVQSTVTLPSGVSEAVFTSTKAGTVTLLSSATESGPYALSVADGMLLVSNIYEIGPEGEYAPPATLVFNYTESGLPEGLLEEDLAVYEYFTDRGWVLLPGQVLDSVNNSVTVPVTNIASLFGVFGIIRDKVAPQTSLVFENNIWRDPAGGVFVNVRSSATLSTYDPVVYGTSTGVAYSEYRVVTGTDAAFIRYEAPFILAEGRNELEFRSADYAGNIEVAKSSIVYVDGTAPMTSPQLSGTSGDNDWFVSSVEVELVSTDSLSGVGFQGYRVDAATEAVAYINSIIISSEGTHIINYSAADMVGNSEAEKSVSFGIDMLPPLTTAYSIPSVNSHGWNKTPVDMIVTGTDAVSGIAYCSSSFTVSGEGYHPVSGYCMDYAGWSSTVTTVVNIDTTAPSISYAALSMPNVAGWYNTLVQVVFAGSDTLSGIEGCSSATITLEGSAQSVPGWCRDIAGNIAHATSTLNIDLTAPMPSTAMQPFPNKYGWHNSPVEVAFSGTDALSGISYCSPGKSVAIEGSSVPVSGYCLDNAGNSSTTTVIVSIDTTPPQVTYILAPVANSNGWNNSAVHVHFSGIDALSGVKDCSISTVSVEGADQKVSGSCSDLAGNIAYATATVNVDLTPAALTISSPLAGQTYIATRGKIGIDFYVADNLDPSPAVEAFLVQVEDRGSPRGARPDRIAVTLGQSIEPLDIDDGLWRLDVTATDKALNVSSATGGAFEIIHDVLAPRTTLTPAGPVYRPAGITYLTSASVFTLSSVDDLVAVEDGIGLGVKNQSVALKAGEQTLKELLFLNSLPKQGEVFVSTFGFAALEDLADGLYSLSYSAADILANAEPAKLLPFALDNTPPYTGLSVAGVSYEAQDRVFVTGASGLTLTGVDISSGGVASGLLLTKYKLSDANWQVYSASFSITAEGLYTLAYYSLDNVQNTEAERSRSIVVDNTPPAASIILGEPKLEAFGLPLITPETPLTLTAVDPGVAGLASGLRSIYYELIDAGGNSSGVLNYTEPFRISAHGTYLMRCWAADNVGNIGNRIELKVAVSNLQYDALAATSSLDMTGSADISGRVEAGIAELNGNARILGDVYASTITVKGKAQITGLQAPLAAGFAIEPLDIAYIVARASASNNNGLVPAQYIRDGILDVSANAVLTLSTGTYYFAGIELTGGSNVIIDGKVDILVAGDVLISGGSYLNAEGPSSKLNIFLSTASDMKFTGGGNLAAYVYAPYSEMKLTGNALLGGHYFVKKAVLSGTGNIIQAGETLPQTAAATGGGGKTKVSAMAVSGAYSVLAGPDAAFRLGEVYVFPNPALRGAAPTLHIEVGIADRVNITIYTVSGRKAHEHIITGMPAVLDDGNGLSYAYEYAWQGNIPSGVYYYSIEAEKAGQKLRKAGKFAVVR